VVASASVSGDVDVLVPSPGDIDCEWLDIQDDYPGQQDQEIAPVHRVVTWITSFFWQAKTIPDAPNGNVSGCQDENHFRRCFGPYPVRGGLMKTQAVDGCQDHNQQPIHWHPDYRLLNSIEF